MSFGSRATTDRTPVDRITTDIGGNLLIESLKDKIQYDSQQQSVGGGVSIYVPPICYGQMVAVTVNASDAKIKADHDSVGAEDEAAQRGQSGLKAGNGGFDVKVAGNTTLIGGVITSTDQAVNDNKNSFNTGGTLTTQDIHNQSELDAHSVSASLSTGSKGSSGSFGYGEVSDNQSSTTKAAISGIAGDVDARTGDNEAGIKPVFTQADAEQVNKSLSVQTGITAAFGQNAAKIVGDIAARQMKPIEDARAYREIQAKQENGETLSPAEEFQLAVLKSDGMTDAIAQSNLADSQLKQDYENWKEGGAYRIGLHVIAGAMGGGVNGAIGAGVSAAAAPLLDEMQAKMTQSLIDSGMNSETARATASLIAVGTAAAAGGIASGGIQGATTAANIDLNNRQLHPVETKRIKELANGDPQKEARLAAAACALVRCADGVPTDDPSYDYLMAMQNAGGNFADEQTLLLRQSSRPGDLTRTFGPLFRYTWVDEYILDPASQNKIGTRLAGAAQGGVGIAGVVGSGALCSTGFGCAAGAVTGTISADYAQSGIRQSITGNASVPYGEQVLQSLGLSPQAATMTYGVLGIAPAAVEAAAINKAASAQVAANTVARQSYEPIASFGAQGIKPTPLVMQSPQAQAIVNEYIATGATTEEATRYAANLLKTGTQLPIPATVGQGVELIKIVPKTATGGDSVSAYSPFFMSRQEFDVIAKLPPEQIAQKLGLPAEQGVRGSQLGFNVYTIKPLPGNTPKVFISDVAPIHQGSYSATGGAQQVLVPNRSQWTDPIRVGFISGTR